MIKVNPRGAKVERVGQLVGCTEAPITKTTMAAMRLAIARKAGVTRHEKTVTRHEPMTKRAKTAAERQDASRARQATYRRNMLTVLENLSDG